MSNRGILVLLAALLVVSDADLVGQYAVRQAYRLRGSFPVFGRPYSLSDQAASASFTVQFPQDVYFQPTQCKQGSMCDGKSVAPCCTSCLNGAPKPGASNPANCFCPRNEDAICLDASKPHEGTLPQAEYFFFEFGLLQTPCQNTILTSQTLSGDQDILLSSDEQVTYDSATTYWESYNLLSDSIVLCAHAGDGDGSYGDGVSMYNDSGVMRHYFGTLFGWLGGKFILSLQEATKQFPNFLLSPRTHYFLAPDAASLTCDTQPGSSLVASPPSMDPGFERYAVLSGAIEVNPDKIPGNLFSMGFYIWYVNSGVLETYYTGNPATCVLNAASFRDSKGNLLPPQKITFEPAPLVCNYNKLVASIEGFEQVVDELQTTDTYSELGSALASGSAWSIQNAWLGCLSYLANNLTSYNTTPVSIASVTACVAPFGSVEYSLDPCCNISLLFSQCCAPRTVMGQSIAAALNEDYIQSKCNTPICSKQVAADYLSIAALGSDYTAGCDAATSAYRNDARLTNDVFTSCIAYVYSNQPCDSETPCLYGLECRTNGFCSEPLIDDPLIECLLTSLYPPFALQFRELVNISINAPMTQFVAAVKQRYTATGCNQPLYVFFHDIGDDYFFRNNDLDNDEAACIEADSFCNWDRYVYDQSTCENTPSWLSPNFCGDCTFYNLPRCYDQSAFPGCFYSYDGRDAIRQARCEAVNGQFDDYWSYLDKDCFFPQYTSQTACVPPAQCPYPKLDIYGMLNCPEYCLFPAIATPDACTCENVGGDQTVCDKYGVSWNTSDEAPVEGCQFTTLPATRNIARDCTSLGGQYWRGSAWQQPSLNTQAACKSDGTCTAPAILDQATCTSSSACSLCRFDSDCNDQYSTPEACAMGGTCTNFFYDTGSCVMPFQVDSLSGRPFCDSFQILDPLGCIDFYYSTPEECTAATGQWLSESTTQQNCQSYKGCNETVFFVLTRKTPQLCASCGGTSQNVFSWTPGTWKQQEWRAYKWQQRQWLHANNWGTIWNRTAFQADLDLMYYRQQAQIARADLLCRNSRIANALKSVGCDCAGGSNCYGVPTPSFVGLSQVCSNTYLNFTPTVATDTSGIAPFSILVSNDTLFSSTCVDILGSMLPIDGFRQPTVSLYSSLFLSSIRDDPYAVVQNSHDVTVGQLQGDSINVEIGDGIDASTVSVGNVTLCLLLKPPASVVKRFTIYDFAISNNKFKATSFRALELNATVRAWNGVDYLCAQIFREGNYAPILRTANPQSKRYKSTLTSTQYNAFVVAATIYSIILVLALWRVFNLFLFTYWQKGDVVARTVLLLPKTVLSVLSVFLFLRILLFVFVPSGVLHSSPVVMNLLLAEVPTGLYFTIFTLMVIWWMELYHRSANLREGFLGQSRTAFIVINAIVYLFLLIVIIVFAAKSGKGPIKPCADAPERFDKSPQIVAKVYKVFVSVTSFTIAAGFLVYGTRLIRLLGAMTQDVRSSLVKFTLVSVACSLGLLIECALLLYAAFGQNNISTVVALVLLIIVEIVPAIALIATMRQPPNPSAPEGCMGDIFWFMFAEKSYFAMTDNSGARSSRRPESERRGTSTTTPSTPEQKLGSASLGGDDDDVESSPATKSTTTYTPPAPPSDAERAARERQEAERKEKRGTAEQRLGTAMLQMDDDDD